MNSLYLITVIFSGLFLLAILLMFLFLRRHDSSKENFIRLETRWNDLQHQLSALIESRLQDQRIITDLTQQLQNQFAEHRQQFNEQQIHYLTTLTDSLQNGLQSIRQQLSENLNSNIANLNLRIGQLTETTESKLQEISGQVEQRLNAGFAQTTATFTDVIKRLALIDEAQKRITELSGNVMGLQEILSDKRSRGVFGEVQLNALVHNVLPESHYALQYTLKNDKRADCVLFLPPPTGSIAIDAKFPLENFRKIMDNHLGASERRNAEQNFRQDIKRHIQDIAEKYIIPNETADGAIMFIPAEAVFAEIHAHYYDLVEYAQKQRVWLASPTTMMAILSTARAVLKDAATREQVHLIQKHLTELAKDFQRFQTRMHNLARHIEQAHGDVQEVKTSAEKITNRFAKIEQVEFSQATAKVFDEQIG